MIGLQHGTVALADHNPNWKELADQIIGRLWGIFGPAAADIQHIGSTAILGIKAKPIIDIAVGVHNLNALDDIVPRLAAGGIDKSGSQSFEGIVLFSVDDESGRRIYNIQVVEHNGTPWQNHIRFRDTMNQCPQKAAAYDKLKRELVERYPNDIAAYMSGKKDFIEALLTRTLTNTIQSSVDLMFHNLGISMKTCDWQADICGAPAWRYIYHTIHSCDKFFINPAVYDEPPFHHPGLDWPDNPADLTLNAELLWEYYAQTRGKIMAYLDTLTNAQLEEIPERCRQNRLQLMLGQFRHMYAHIGILNGITIAHTAQYPHVINDSNWKAQNLPESLFAGKERP